MSAFDWMQGLSREPMCCWPTKHFGRLASASSVVWSDGRSAVFVPGGEGLPKLPEEALPHAVWLRSLTRKDTVTIDPWHLVADIDARGLHLAATCGGQMDCGDNEYCADCDYCDDCCKSITVAGVEVAASTIRHALRVLGEHLDGGPARVGRAQDENQNILIVDTWGWRYMLRGLSRPHGSALYTPSTLGLST